MSILSSILLGIVQGLTEFIPVSSSGHLVIFHDILNWQTADNIAFDVFLHWGTLLALILFFYKDIILYLKAFLKSLIRWELKTDLDQRVSWYILISMAPAAIVGYFFEDIIENFFRNFLSVAIWLILVGLLFLAVEKIGKKRLDLSALNWQKSLLLGVAQALALIPGVSRSGITISSALALNFNREVAARFSFIMSIPIIFAAGVKKAIDISVLAISSQEILSYVLGFFTAALFGYLAIKFLMNYFKNHSLAIFAYYRIILGSALLVYFFII